MQRQADPGTEVAGNGAELALFASARNWNRYVANVLRPYIGARVLEVGAGTGNRTAALCREDIENWLCLEPNTQLASEIRTRIRDSQLPGNCRVQVSDLGRLDPTERFDTILYLDVLEHIEADREELSRARQYLANGGFMVVLAPAWQWLFTPFDAAVGHYRRYNRRQLLDIAPADLKLEKQCYIDSAGFIASLGNRLVLKSSMPTMRQIQLWDRFLVPTSQHLDRILGGTFGKSVIVVWSKTDA